MSVLRSIFLICAASLAIASCGSQSSGGSASADSQVDPASVDPESVDPAALQQAVDNGDVRRFYEATNWQPVWDKAAAGALVEALGQAPRHALMKEMFLPAAASKDPAAHEAALTKAALAYAGALANGKIDPKQIRDIYTLPRPQVDVVAGLAQALKAGKVGQWLASLPPQTAEYKTMSDAFVRYAEQADRSGKTAIEDGDLIRPGGSDPRVPRIVQALQANGYLQQAPEQRPNPNAYTEQIANAVRRMQQDFGIASDGVIGEDTLRLLNTGARDRARQLAVNLERLRWQDRNPAATRIDVNTAAAMLDYWRDGQHRDRRRVVVGQPGWETPQLGSPIFQLVANPNWVVPESIAEEELAEKSQAWLQANNFVRKDGKYVQQPGPESALGLVKFAMKNDHAIYLHDTPAKALFGQSDRHDSHGCVRVQGAVDFAREIAAAQGVLPQFDKAMAGDEETPVDLKAQIPVRLIYQTAFLGPNGQLVFTPDAYGWDEDIARALGREAREVQRVRVASRASDVGP